MGFQNRHCERKRSNPARKWIAASLTLLAMTVYLTSAFAEDDDFAERLVLAEKMLEINPARDQVERAVDAYIANYLFAYPDNQKQVFRASMLNVIKPKALEKRTIDAYAELYTKDELAAMVEYYSKPEAKSARAKQTQLQNMIAPELTRTLDQALIKLRTQYQERE